MRLIWQGGWGVTILAFFVYLTIAQAQVLQGRPPLGWNSYDGYTCTVTEDEVKENAQLIAKYLLPYGYDTVTIDYEWFRPGTGQFDCASEWGTLLIDDYGRLIPSPDRYPSSINGTGFKAIGDYIHSLGLKFGIHIMRGIPRIATILNTPIYGSRYFAQDATDKTTPCWWSPDMWGVNMSSPAGQAYYNSIVQLYAAWGVDFIKMDCAMYPFFRDEILGVSAGIANSRRPMVFSLSPGDTPATKYDVENAETVRNNLTVYRVTNDVWDNWQAITWHWSTMSMFHNLIGNPSFPDADMLPLGYLSVRGGHGPPRWSGLTRDEERVMMTMWAITRSPLILGAALPETLQNPTQAAWYLSLWTNQNMLDVNQYSTGNRPINDYAWIASAQNMPLTSNISRDSTIVALFNSQNNPIPVTVEWGRIGLGDNLACRVHELWEHTDYGFFENAFTSVLPMHSCMFVTLSSCQPTPEYRKAQSVSGGAYN